MHDRKCMDTEVERSSAAAICKAGKHPLFWPFPDRLHLEPYLYLMFYDLNGLIESKRDNAQHNDTGYHHIQLEYLGAVDNQIPQSPSRGQKFPDDDAHQCQSDIDFGGAQENRDGPREDNLGESVTPASPQGIDQSDFLRIHLAEACVKADDRAEDGDGHAGHNDGPGACAKPHDEQGGQGGFWQAV